MLTKNSIVLIAITVVCVLFFYMYERQNPPKDFSAEEAAQSNLDSPPYDDESTEVVDPAFGRKRTTMSSEDSLRLTPVFKTLDSLAKRVNANPNDRVAYDRFNSLYDSLMTYDSLMAKVNRQINK